MVPAKTLCSTICLLANQTDDQNQINRKSRKKRGCDDGKRTCHAVYEVKNAVNDAQLQSVYQRLPVPVFLELKVAEVKQFVGTRLVMSTNARRTLRKKASYFSTRTFSAANALTIRMLLNICSKNVLAFPSTSRVRLEILSDNEPTSVNASAATGTTDSTKPASRGSRTKAIVTMKGSSRIVRSVAEVAKLTCGNEYCGTATIINIAERTWGL